MADLEDLGYKSVSDMTTDEAIEHLRMIRLSRRVPLKNNKYKTSKKAQAKQTTNITVKSMDAEQIANLLKTLGG